MAETEARNLSDPNEVLGANPFVQHFYPVLGVLNSPQASDNDTETSSSLTPYARQVGRSILKYFRGGGDSNQGVVWDAAIGQAPRWHTVSFGSIDDVPRRRAFAPSGSGKAAEDSGLSPRDADFDGSILSPRWLTKQQRRRPATLISLHALATGPQPSDAADAALGAEIARTRVCAASMGLTYTAVVIVSRAAQTDERATDARLTSVGQLGGVEASQLAVCYPGSAQQFQVFVQTLERQAYGRAAAYYADAFARTQAKIAQLPAMPLPRRPESPGGVRAFMEHRDASGELCVAAVVQDDALVARFTRYMAVRAWLARYHYKAAVFAEAAGDRDTAQRALWIAYTQLMAYLGEIVGGAYDPGDGWLRPRIGGLVEGAGGDALHVRETAGDEAVWELLEAVHVRLVRGWVYRSMEAAAKRRAEKQQAGGGWAYAFGGGAAQGAVPTPVSRSSGRLLVSPAGSTPVSPMSPVAARVAGGNGSLDPLVSSVHSGEWNTATVRLMEIERQRRKRGTSESVCFVALGSETSGVDLILPLDFNSPSSSAQQQQQQQKWWPLGGHYGVVDVRGRPSLILNNSGGSTQNTARVFLAAAGAYDACLALAGRQCAEHVVALALLLSGDGVGFWSAVARQYAMQAAVKRLAGADGVDFAAAAASCTQASLASPGGASAVGALVGGLRQPVSLKTLAMASEAPGPQVTPLGAGGGRRRAGSAAFAGFAFDQALGGIYAVAEAPATHATAATAATAAADAAHAPWMWPPTPAPLLHAASQASLHHARALSAASSADTDVVVAVRSQALRLLADALSCTGGASALDAARDIYHTPLQPDTTKLEQLLRGGVSLGDRARGCLALAGDLAEAYAELGMHAEALRVLHVVVARVRYHGWTVLTQHALQGVVRCADALGDSAASVRARIELLSPALVACEDERRRTAEHLALTFALPSAEQVEVDMWQVYSPITCHAHWRHWRVGPTGRMAFQLALDCTALPVSLPADAAAACELLVEFSDARHNVRVAHDASVQPAEINIEDGATGSVCYVDLQRQRACDLRLRPCVTVVEGSVQLDAACGLLAIEAVVLSLGSVRLRWPTCAATASLPTATAAVAATAATVPADADGALNAMEALLLARCGVQRMLDGVLGAANRLAVRADVAAAGDVALRRALHVTGPSASLPRDLRWLCVSSDDARRSAQWTHLPSPPLTCRTVTDQPPLTQGAREEPLFSAYSRCRVVCVDETKPSPVSVSLPGVQEQQQAVLRGEAFAVCVRVRNTHGERALARVSVRVQVEVDVAERADRGLLDEQRAGDAVAVADSAAALGGRPWVSLTRESGVTDRSSEVVVELPEGVPVGQAVDRTVYVCLPEPLLSAAVGRRAQNTVVAVRCKAQYAFDPAGEWAGETAAHALLPVVRPLHVHVEPLAAHVPAHHVHTSSSSDVVFDQETHCFRRPLLVSIRNTGPWDLCIEHVALRTPETAGGLDVRLVGSTAHTAGEQPSAVVVAAGAAQRHVFWLDIVTSDLVRMPEYLCPGTLEVHWRRQGTDASPVVARLWLPVVKLLSRCVQVESWCGMSVARVGQSFELHYRVTNPTRSAKCLEAVMHAAEGFVFSGPRRVTLSVLPGRACLLHFTLLPISAVAQQPAVNSGDAPLFAPGQAVLGKLLAPDASQGRAAFEGNVTGSGWLRLPRLDVKLVARQAQGPGVSTRTLKTGSDAPPPTRNVSTVGKLNNQVDGDTACRVLLQMAGLNEHDVQGLEPALADACADCVPEHMLPGAQSMLCGPESDVDSDDEYAEPLSAVAGLSGDSEEIVRFDETSIFCLPEA